MDSDLQVVVVDGHFLDEFVEECSAFDLGCFVPEPVEVEAGEQFGDLFEPVGDVVVSLGLGLVEVGVGAGRFDECGESGFLLAEEFGGELAVVVQLQELASLLEQLLQSVRRGWRAPAGWRRRGAPLQLSAYCVLECCVPSDQPKA